VVFFLSLEFPQDYSEMLAAMSAPLSVLIAVAGGIFGLRKHKDNQLFRLGLESSFAKHLFNKQVEFYEQYCNKLDELRNWLLEKGIPDESNSKDFFNHLRELILLGGKFEKWLSEKQVKEIRSIEQNHIELHTDAGLTAAHGRSGKERDKEREYLEKASGKLEELLGEDGYDKYKNELKRVFYISDVVYIQEHVVVRGGKLAKEKD
jgi:hypothetical protein